MALFRLPLETSDFIVQEQSRGDPLTFYRGSVNFYSLKSIVDKTAAIHRFTFFYLKITETTKNITTVNCVYGIEHKIVP